MNKIMNFVREHDTLFFYLGIVLIALLLVGFCLSGIGNAYASNVTDDNRGQRGYILVNNGYGQGHQGTWTNVDDLGFVNYDELKKEADNRIVGDNLLTTNLNSEIDQRKKDIDKLTGSISDVDKNSQSRDTDLQKNIDNETNSRIKQDNEIIDSVNSTINQVNLETSRAISAESNLQDNLTYESILRQTSDTNLQNNINGETNRAVIAENNLQTNINSEAFTRYNADQKLQSNIDQVNSRVDDVSNRVSKLEKTQFGVRTEIKFIREKHLEVGVYNFYSGTRNKVAEVGLNVVIPIGESYLDRENKQINVRLDRLEKNLGQSTVITRTVDKKGKVKSISISQGQLLVNGQF